MNRPVPTPVTHYPARVLYWLTWPRLQAANYEWTDWRRFGLTDLAVKLNTIAGLRLDPLKPKLDRTALRHGLDELLRWEGMQLWVAMPSHSDDVDAADVAHSPFDRMDDLEVWGPDGWFRENLAMLGEECTARKLKVLLDAEPYPSYGPQLWQRPAGAALAAHAWVDTLHKCDPGQYMPQFGGTKYKHMPVTDLRPGWVAFTSAVEALQPARPLLLETYCDAVPTFMPPQYAVTASQCRTRYGAHTAVAFGFIPGQHQGNPRDPLKPHFNAAVAAAPWGIWLYGDPVRPVEWFRSHAGLPAQVELTAALGGPR